MNPDVSGEHKYRHGQRPRAAGRRERAAAARRRKARREGEIVETKVVGKDESTRLA